MTHAKTIRAAMLIYKTITSISPIENLKAPTPEFLRKSYCFFLRKALSQKDEQNTLHLFAYH